MGTKGRITPGAVAGLTVIGTVPANGAGDDRTGGRGASASARQTRGDGTAGTAAAFPGDGTYRIGEDVRPGTCRTTGNVEDRCCRERDRGAPHGPRSVLAAGSAPGTSVMTIGADDACFRTVGCENRERTGRHSAAGHGPTNP